MRLLTLAAIFGRMIESGDDIFKLDFRHDPGWQKRKRAGIRIGKG